MATVKELIEKLSNFPENCTVFVAVDKLEESFEIDNPHYETICSNNVVVLEISDNYNYNKI